MSRYIVPYSNKGAPYTQTMTHPPLKKQIYIILARLWYTNNAQGCTQPSTRATVSLVAAKPRDLPESEAVRSAGAHVQPALLHNRMALVPAAAEARVIRRLVTSAQLRERSGSGRVSSGKSSFRSC